ncbi:hypothetical protein ATEG_08291 [Paecilomyces variotii No. 5]|uniref:cysteine--tRNA ligase n=1 Tax=Byssochlamys spectabilis (strain No. 5 / NBRC 109023) TaxID=1356009 RepID=V5I635_BYSSN|nr:hypothetical protein ATEG_08291 [Paecilomyces variotii No. 5]
MAPTLRVFDSLVKEKTTFSTSDPNGKTVTWYTCGPTVYDEAHLGHCRSAISIDILRRIMRDYFGFSVRFVMNVTDIDDKIIIRSRYQYLGTRLQKELESMEKTKAVTEAISIGRAAIKHYISTYLPLLPSDIALEAYSVEAKRLYHVADGEQTDQTAKLEMHMKNCQSAIDALVALESVSDGTALSDFLLKAKDVLHPYLDFLHGTTIDSQDHGIFTGIAQKYEKLYFDDMRALNVLDPDVITRATEFIPQMIKFVERIITKGFAYTTADGSVYFDIAAFEEAGHPYPRLEPGNRNNSALRADGEGSLANKSAVKRNDVDFALWKGSRPGEPAWPTPWSKVGGRPGWHLECSVMASEVLGSEIDIHSGGEDLRFPHHDNELAQSTAYWSTAEKPAPWVNHFLHTGHLGIQGLKMSKSLKNFITLKDLLQRPDWTPRLLRICFLLGAWHDQIEITDEMFKTAVAWESKMNNFFRQALDCARSPQIATAESDVTQDKSFASLDRAKNGVYEALCDSFDTPTAMKLMSELVSECYNMTSLSDTDLLVASKWLTYIVTIFGLNPEGEEAVLGQGKGKQLQGPFDPQILVWHGVEIPLTAQEPIYAAAKLRDDVRQHVLSAGEEIDHNALGKLIGKYQFQPKADENTSPYYTAATEFRTSMQHLVSEKASKKEILKLCDDFRDIQLFSLDIYLEDREDLPALVRPLDASLRRALAERKATALAAASVKAKQKAENIEKQLARDEQAKIKPGDLFRDKALYSEWDELGIPTRDASGNEITKSARKKLIKLHQKQAKLHEEWLGRTRL